jgi:hypothetical protein
MTKQTTTRLKLKPKKTDIITGVYTITPEIAKAMLASNTQNRKLQQNVIDNYARDMEGGRWHLNGEAISFSTTGRLLNGQHRLNAIVQSGISVDIQINENVDEAAFKSIDTGRKRSAGDVLAMMGHHNNSQIASLTRVLINYRDGISFNRARTTSELVEACTQEPDIIPFVHRVRTLTNRQVRSIGFAGPLYLAKRFAGKHAEIEDFIVGLEKGTNMNGDDPRLVLRERLPRLVRPDGNLVWNLTTAALNSYLAGRTLKRVYAKTLDDNRVMFSEPDCAPRAFVQENWGI